MSVHFSYLLRFMLSAIYSVLNSLAFFFFFFFSHSVSLYSTFLQLCVSAQSQWTYCILFALTSQSPAGKQSLVS